jgi:hypothetical protein
LSFSSKHPADVPVTQALGTGEKMRYQDTPFPPFWWGIALDSAGLKSVRPDLGTYGMYSYSALPQLPFALSGDFNWLSQASSFDQGIGTERSTENSVALGELEASAEPLGLKLPREFIKFMKDPSLHTRVRSNTDCFLDLCRVPVASPLGDGFLVRFLADSQGCLFWYLYLKGSGAYAVVVSPGFYGAPEEEWQDETPEPSDLAFCAESFEEFMCRFWIENELWFAADESQPLAPGVDAYVASYLRVST